MIADKQKNPQHENRVKDVRDVVPPWLLRHAPAQTGEGTDSFTRDNGRTRRVLFSPSIRLKNEYVVDFFPRLQGDNLIIAFQNCRPTLTLRKKKIKPLPPAIPIFSDFKSLLRITLQHRLDILIRPAFFKQSYLNLLIRLTGRSRLHNEIRQRLLGNSRALGNISVSIILILTRLQSKNEKYNSSNNRY